jgi:hypothetical protein
MLIELDPEMKSDVAKILKSMIIDSTVSMVRTYCNYNKKVLIKNLIITKTFLL